MERPKLSEAGLDLLTAIARAESMPGRYATYPSLKQLGAELGVTKQRAFDIACILVSRGFLERTDAVERNLRLTEQGRAAVKAGEFDFHANTRPRK